MGYVSGASRRVRVNYVSNYGIFGPASRSDDLFRGNEDSNVKIFQRGNLIDVNRNRRFDGVDRGWSMFGYDYDRMDEAVQLQPVTTHTADEALDLVLSQAGARPWSRDRVDLRIVRDVENGTGDLIDSQSDVDGPTLQIRDGAARLLHHNLRGSEVPDALDVARPRQPREQVAAAARE